jgi:GST-like protein
MERPMIDLYYAPTPNGLKLRLFLEEAELPYRLITVSLGKGEQFKPEFLAISPNNKIPAIVDHAPLDGGAPLSVFESGAILEYLADKIGRFVPTDARGRLELRQWLYWQMSALGPMAGQVGHFNVYAPEPVPYAIERYTNELRRLYGVLDRRLEGREYIVDDYSIVDMACYPWIVPHRAHGQDLAAFPHLARWFAAMADRPAVRCTYDRVVDVYAKSRHALSDAEGRILFGSAKPGPEDQSAKAGRAPGSLSLVVDR